MKSSPAAQRTQMLQRTGRPNEIVLSQIGRQCAHVREAKSDVLRKARLGAEPTLVERLGGRRVLAGGNPAACLRFRCGQIGGDDVAAPGRAESGQWFLAHGKAQPAPARLKHAPLVQRLGDETPLPNLAMQV